MDEQERLRKLENKVGELWLLVGVLLNRSGLDRAGIERAHDWAETAWLEVVQQAAQMKAEAWRATPEGRQFQRDLEEAQRRRLRELWREDSLEAGRILPDPTASKPD